MESSPEISLDSKVAICLKEYLASTDDERERHRRWLCSGLSFLLGRRVKTHDEWGQWRWIDSLYPDNVEVVGPKQIRIVGQIVWGVVKGTTQQWVEPAEVMLGLTTSEDSVLVEAKIGDAAIGLGTLTYAERDAWRKRPKPSSWVIRL